MFLLVKKHTHYELLVNGVFVRSYDLNERKEALQDLYDLQNA